MFGGDELTRRDIRFDYGEPRFVTAGYLAGPHCGLVWTPRGSAIHIISMRHAHAKEERKWTESAWVDPDDAPELDDAFFAEADHRRNGELVQRGRGRPKLANGKALVSIRLDRDVLEGPARPRSGLADEGQCRLEGVAQADKLGVLVRTIPSQK